jgi:hypothetical protein
MASRNSAKSSSTGVSPFFALFGYEPVISVEAEYKGVDPATGKRFAKISESIEKSKEIQKAQFDKGSTNVPSLVPGNNVLIRKFGYRPALDPVYDKESSVVVEKRGENSYNVQRSNGAVVPVNVKDLRQVNLPVQASRPKPWDKQQSSVMSSPAKVIPSTSSVSKPVVSKDVGKPQDRLIGRRVQVWWPQYKKYFHGTVARKTRRIIIRIEGPILCVTMTITRSITNGSLGCPLVVSLWASTNFFLLVIL